VSCENHIEKDMDELQSLSGLGRGSLLRLFIRGSIGGWGFLRWRGLCRFRGGSLRDWISNGFRDRFWHWGRFRNGLRGSFRGGFRYGRGLYGRWMFVSWRIHNRIGRGLNGLWRRFRRLYRRCGFSESFSRWCSRLIALK
jgi:hypothetical protein